ncbi:MAG: hypothetical protein COA32_10175 [Fluviicola sp.]|nr:MAG: hypothetical protein COA32_10175 [Fluviicola sp.]
MNKINLLFVLLLIAFISACNSDKKIIIGNGNDVIVTMDVIDKKGIEKIEFQTELNIEVVTSNDLKRHNKIQYRFNSGAEGTYSVCVYSIKDTICRTEYIENGYRPNLKCDSKEIKSLDQTDILY